MGDDVLTHFSGQLNFFVGGKGEGFFDFVCQGFHFEVR